MERKDNIEAYKSPNKNHDFYFVREGEIRFGPSYYKIVLDGQTIEDRVFGLEFKWHPNSTFLALQEWLATDSEKGPITALTLIDLNLKKFTQISIANKGFIRPIKFGNNLIVFEKEYSAQGKIIEYEIELESIKDWK